MKKKFTLLMMLCFIGITSVFADPITYTGTVTTNSGSTPNPFTLNSVSWEYETTKKTGSPSVTYGTAYSKSCIKFGTGASNCYSKVTLSTNYFKSNGFAVSAVEINAIGSSKKNVTMKIGSDEITEEIPSNAWTTIGLQGLDINGQDLSISFALTDAAIFINYIKVTYNVGETYTVTFNSNGGSGEMSEVSNIRGNYSLPTCTFTAPSGKEFSGWKANNAGNTLMVGDNYNVTTDVCFYAQWVEIGTIVPGKYTLGPNWNAMFGTEYNGVITGITANNFELNCTYENISLDIKNGSSTNGYVTNTEFRAYNGYKLKFSAPTGYSITKIEMNKGGKTISTLTPNVGTISYESDNSSATWEGLSNSVEISVGATVGFSTISVTFGKMDIEITDAGWATACVPFNATLSGDVTAYYVKTDGGSLVKTPVAADGIIVAEAGLLLKSNNGGAATATFTEVAYDESKVDVDAYIENQMVGSVAVGGTDFAESNTMYYILANDANTGIGFYYQKDTEGVMAHCDQYKALLSVPESGAKAEGFSLEDEATGINAVDNSQCTMQNSQLYNLQGVRVNDSYKGIVIVNGKKYLNK